jgi:hypothetical protein
MQAQCTSRVAATVEIVRTVDIMKCFKRGKRMSQEIVRMRMW